MKNNQIKPWGGSWTETKLQAFESYVTAYLNIMLSQKKKYNGWPTIIYFDGFAGSGDNGANNQPENDFYLNFASPEELSIYKGSANYKGSAERVLSLEKRFDEYHFVDIDKNAISKLKILLENKGLNLANCKFVHNDVNEELKKFANNLTKQKAALVLLDPFGMNIEWGSIESLKDRRVDLWILVPSGVIINRFLDKQCELKSLDKLEAFFGLSEKEIKRIFYKKQKIILYLATKKK
jgi:three-Cys-motif partner protein